MMGGFPSGPMVVISGREQYIETAKRHRAVIERLCLALAGFFDLSDELRDAIEAYLSFDIDLALENPMPMPPIPAYEPPNMMDVLMKVQEERESVVSQIEALDKLCEGMPKDMGEAFRAVNLPGLQRLLRDSEDRITAIQKMIETSDKG